VKNTVPAAHNLYAFNETRQSFLSLGVMVADTPLTRLRGFLGRMRLNRDDAIWVVPSQGIHTIGLLFPIDVIYLDAGQRVIHLIEHLGPLRIAPIRRTCATVLELPTRSIYGSGTQIGDQLMICPPETIYAYWQADEAAEPSRRDKGA
jgi:uncharacterized protein